MAKGISGGISKQTNSVIGISVAILIFGTLGWEGINALFAANATGVSSIVVTIGKTVLGAIAAIAVLLKFLE